MSEIIFKDEVYAIVGASMEVYNQLGHGFLESVYQESLEIEFASKRIPFVPQKEIFITYKNKQLKKSYIADFLCYNGVLVEIKALDKLSSREDSQLINYLKATKFQVGVLINFGSHPSLEWRRLVLTDKGETRTTKSPPQIKISENLR